MTQPNRFFEDFTPGLVLEGGDFEMTEEEIVTFARRYDPQPFHTDHAAARASMFGELVASGWNTASVAMRLMVDHFFGAGGSMGSPGMEELRWPRPVRVGDRLRLRVTVEQARISQSKPDRGLVHFHTEVLNQNGEVVMSVRGMAFFRRRTSPPPAAASPAAS